MLTYMLQYVQLAAACSALIAGCFVGWRKVNAKKGSKKKPEVSDIETAKAENSIKRENLEKDASK